ncbi:hypothetical protein F2P81_011378 [Scophthalmus maximus]|uniref:Uncharacterized protein n=1 Tax=Scophthalmus maximus TaxID=52904 RepID=A0A6A4SLI1_SCOMX|nr:hypothetical protein F2P81_011378 [Scophthalmus maximus]
MKLSPPESAGRLRHNVSLSWCLLEPEIQTGPQSQRCWGEEGGNTRRVNGRDLDVDTTAPRNNLHRSESGSGPDEPPADCMKSNSEPEDWSLDEERVTTACVDFTLRPTITQQMQQTGDLLPTSLCSYVTCGFHFSSVSFHFEIQILGQRNRKPLQRE